MNRYFGVALIVIALSGCATAPVATGDTRPVPADRVLSSEYAKTSPNSGLAVVKRDAGYLGSTCKLRLSVNAKPVAELLPAERVELHLPAGEHILSIDPNGRCGGGLAEVTATVRPGASSAYRISFSESGEFHIAPTAF